MLPVFIVMGIFTKIFGSFGFLSNTEKGLCDALKKTDGCVNVDCYK